MEKSTQNHKFSDNVVTAIIVAGMIAYIAIVVYLNFSS